MNVSGYVTAVVVVTQICLVSSGFASGGRFDRSTAVKPGEFVISKQQKNNRNLKLNQNFRTIDRSVGAALLGIN